MKVNKFILKSQRRKYIFCIMAFLLSLFTSFHSVYSQQNLIYYLEIDEERWDSFIVNITVRNNRSEHLLCGIPNLSSWFFNHSLSETDISDFKVSGEYGVKLLFNQVNLNTWLVNAKDNDIVTISYRVKNNNDRILGERIDKNFARVDGGTVFIYIRELRHVPIRLVVRVPHEWKLATGLKPTNQIFEYSVDNYEQLIKNPLYMAPFNEIFFNIGDRTGYLIIDGNPTFNIGKLGTMTSKIVTSQIELFRDIPFDQYLFILKVFPGPRRIISKAYENTSIVYFSDQTALKNLLAIVREVASDFFQVWNGNRFYPISMEWNELSQNQSTSELWFYYGVSDYYGCLSMARAGIWTEEEFFKYHINLINRLFRYSDIQMPSTATLSSQIKYDYKKTVDYLRLKGHLLGLILDLKIRNLTDNHKSLDDVMYFMNKWFGEQNIGYNDDDILRAICAVSGADLTSFSDLYINGTVELPVCEILKTVGVFIESEIDTLPYLGEITLSERENIVTEISEKGPLEVAGLKIGDKLLSLNNQRIYYPQQLEQIADSLAIGQEVDIFIQRENIPLMLIATVVGKACKIVTCDSLNPQTEHQAMIRKNWLSNRNQ